MSVSHNLGFLPKSVHTLSSRVGHQDYILLYTRRQVLSTTDTPCRHAHSHPPTHSGPCWNTKPKTGDCQQKRQSRIHFQTILKLDNLKPSFTGRQARTRAHTHKHTFRQAHRQSCHKIYLNPKL